MILVYFKSKTANFLKQIPCTCFTFVQSLEKPVWLSSIIKRLPSFSTSITRVSHIHIFKINCFAQFSLWHKRKSTWIACNTMQASFSKFFHKHRMAYTPIDEYTIEWILEFVKTNTTPQTELSLPSLDLSSAPSPLWPAKLCHSWRSGGRLRLRRRSCFHGILTVCVCVMMMILRCWLF